MQSCVAPVGHVFAMLVIPLAVEVANLGERREGKGMSADERPGNSCMNRRTAQCNNKENRAQTGQDVPKMIQIRARIR